MVRAQATASAAPPTGTRPGGSKARAGPAGRHMEDLPRWDDTSGGSAHSGAYGQAVTTKPRRRAVLTRRSRALHDSLTIAPDHQGVNSTDTPRPTRPARTGRLVLATVAAGSAAALLLAGCGSGAPARPAPAAAAPAPGAGVAADPAGAPGPGGTATAPSGAPAASAGAPRTALPAAPAGTASADGTDQDLAAVDRALGDLDTQLTDADRAVATPAGDMRSSPSVPASPPPPSVPPS